VTTLADAETQIRAALGVELPAGGLQCDGRIHRFGPKRRCWYVLREYTTKRGARVVVGRFGDWKLGQVALEVERTQLADDEWREFQRRREADARREAERRAQRAHHAANRARQQWMSASVEGSSPYLARKGVTGEFVKYFTDGTVLVPAWRFDQPNERGQATMVGLQKIAPDGTKRFNRGMEKQGAAHRIGKQPVEGEPMLLAEGLATALTLREATDRAYPVFIAFDAGNLLPVAKILRERYPKSPLLVCADDDWKTTLPDGDPHNTGVVAAGLVAAKIPLSLFARPIFPPGTERGDKDTDFNDLAARAGLPAVREQLLAAIAIFDGPAPAPQEGGVSPAADKSGKVEKRKRKAPAADEIERAQAMRKRYVLIEGTETAWDTERHALTKVSALRLQWGDAFKLWIEGHWGRRQVWRENVVFDPSCSVDPATHINLFDGFPIAPSPDVPPTKWLTLLQFLCGEADQDQAPITDWVLKWLAYPLQHPGAKMKTAIVMHGQEGAGKNVLFNAVQDLYGRHGGMIGQQQLESQFTGWMSAKCFLIANEVLSRQELRQHIGKLKGLVTEATVMVNEKNLPERAEANVCNLVFLSNELQPLWIDAHDRRYAVIRTPAAREDAFYREVGAELAAGGLAGLYHYLLHLDLGDFSEHTKPPMTEAKAQLANLGRSSPQLFFEAWRDGELDLPYGGAALLEDLFKAYRIFCARIGERNPAKINRFSAELVDCGATKRERQRVPHGLDPASMKTRQMTVFVTAPQPSGYEVTPAALLRAREGLWQMQSDGARAGDAAM
jgi:putative DNA primase/helicase